MAYAPNAGVRVVPTDDEHVAGYHDVLARVARERRWFGIVEAPPLDASREFVRSARATGGVHVVAVDAAGQVLGWCDVARFEREGFRHGGRLGIGLLPEARGRGIGRRLMEAALAASWAAGAERVELEVYASNVRAIALYERLGFVTEGLKRRARKLDGAYDDNVLMARFAPDDDVPSPASRDDR